LEKIEIDAKKLDLLKRSNDLLDKTRKNASKFSKERKILLDLTVDKNVNYDKWESILEEYEKTLIL
jgi:hypothetical protein